MEPLPQIVVKYASREYNTRMNPLTLLSLGLVFFNRIYPSVHITLELGELGVQLTDSGSKFVTIITQRCEDYCRIFIHKFCQRL
jgi:hypothetical protein